MWGIKVYIYSNFIVQTVYTRSNVPLNSWSPPVEIISRSRHIFGFMGDIENDIKEWDHEGKYETNKIYFWMGGSADMSAIIEQASSLYGVWFNYREVVPFWNLLSNRICTSNIASNSHLSQSCGTAFCCTLWPARVISESYVILLDWG
jgi:hypothetical protein